MATVTAVAEKPVLFSGPMVNAILAGRKTVTRRVVKAFGREGNMDVDYIHRFPTITVPPYLPEWAQESLIERSRFQRGTRLWVRETWRTHERPEDMLDGILFAADGSFQPIENTRKAADLWVDAHENGRHGEKWRPSIFMRRWMSRLTLSVVSLSIERVQDITEEDAVAEGFAYESFPSRWPGREYQIQARGGFRALWEKLNAKRGYGWDVNPFVERVEFRVIEPAAPS